MLIIAQMIVMPCLNAVENTYYYCEPLNVAEFCKTSFWVITVIVDLLKLSYLLLFYSLWATEKIYILTDGSPSLLNNEDDFRPADDYMENNRISRISVSALPFSYPAM